MYVTEKRKTETSGTFLPPSGTLGGHYKTFDSSRSTSAVPSIRRIAS